MSPPPTQRLYWEDARRKTALAAVTGHAAGGFLLDRTLLHAPDASYHHRQPCDRGHVLVEGHKLKVHKVAWDRGRMIHRTDGPLPAPGAKAQLHIDAERRELQARAHTLLHLLLAALAEARADVLDAEVVGGGEVKLRASFRDDPKLAWPKAAARAAALVEARHAVEASWVPRDDLAKRTTPQHVPLDAVAPGEPTLRVVRIGEVALPCDAPLVERTPQVGAFRTQPPQPAKGSTRLRAKLL